MTTGYQAVLIWSLLGFISGFLTSRAISQTGKNILPDILFGMLGGVLGGSVCSISGLGTYSVSVAPGAGVLAVLIFQTLRRRWLLKHH